mmetsp:Transcript_8529/g.17013  ORF Transcript_8529/g.17013 Transcript_8529/m.17013 type:complete len:106 (+) Transcript_8529:340-657(+)
MVPLALTHCSSNSHPRRTASNFQCHESNQPDYCSAVCSGGEQTTPKTCKRCSRCASTIELAAALLRPIHLPARPSLTLPLVVVALRRDGLPLLSVARDLVAAPRR